MCGVEKPLGDFHKRGKSQDGFQAMCKECDKATKRVYYAANKEKMRARAAAYRAANPDKVRALNDKWRAANPERAREIPAAWRKANPERNAKLKREWDAANPDKVRSNSWRQGQRRRKAPPTPAARDYVEVLNGDPCAYCGGPMEEKDHIVPLFDGATETDWSDLTASCLKCNRSKGTKSLLLFLLARAA
jgi:hypothetical protein